MVRSWVGSLLGILLVLGHSPLAAGPGESFQGNGDLAGPVTGACCLTDGSCALLTEVDCNAAGGQWMGANVQCSRVLCAQPTAACCFSRGFCQQLLEEDCKVAGGTWQGFGNDCGIFQCPQPQGACCLDAGNCFLLLEADCDLIGGSWQGFGTDCMTFECPQPVAACCAPDGTCQDLEEDECIAGGGIWQGFGTMCAATFCPPPLGACCFDDGTCQDLSEADCTAMGGLWSGAGLVCNVDIFCPPPVEACCFADGTCAEITAADCAAQGGIAQGPMTICATTVCPEPLGACCLLNAACDDLTFAACAAAGGQWLGAGTTCAASTCPSAKCDATEKGSIVIFPKVEIRWDAAGTLIQDTFISIANDYPANIRVKMYFINGDPPLPAAGAERAHPGWNWVNNLIVLTGNEPTCWSARSGLPEGVSPFSALDPGFPPGRPDPEVPGERMLRGYIIAFAVDALGAEVRWNHLAGIGTIVNYPRSYAWEYNGCSFRAIEAVPHGALTGTPGVLNLDGVEFAMGPSQLLMPFTPSGSAALSGPVLVTVENDLTLLPLSADLRQETDGPITTKAHFDVWNGNEVKFSGAYRCITCWDQTLLSNYGAPNHFTVANLQSDCGRARIDGLASQLCNLDFDPSNNDTFPFPPGPGDVIDPRDIVSVDAALLGVKAKLLSFGANGVNAAAGHNLFGMGSEAAVIRFDLPSVPQESTWPQSPDEWIEWILREFGMGETAP